ncbi:putative beta-barrel porin 2 [Fluviicoccus keumensis]|uniref:Putative beta-barrel porin 2 n=1 Tax=Fluviicoccus keumensis TaxID=1435465 RepID=A0A4Q7ZAH1_9GAMM|nr:outer membrane beta-barrel protein [Fluviicoccus keumensis]RZU47592.1 putative beta-barrel porin 2 [Fluviicoccus keumensis]
MERKLKLGVASLGMGLVMGSTVASADIALNPQAIQYDAFSLIPVLGAKTGVDNNLYNLSKSEVSSSFIELNPALALVARERNNQYQLAYTGTARSYANASDDSFFDQNFVANAHVEPNARLRVDAGAAYKMLHDDRGAGRSSGMGLQYILDMGEVDKFNVTSVSVGMQYGAPDAMGRFTLGYGIDQKRYSRGVVNTPSFGAGTTFDVSGTRDNDAKNLGAGLTVHVTAKTALGVEYESSRTDYKGVTPDTKDNRIYGTVVWENTAMTTGKFRIGDGKRDIATGGKEKKVVWDLGAIWTPFEADRVDISAGQRAYDGDSAGSTTIAKNYSVTWQHSWIDRVSTSLTLARTDEQYLDSFAKEFRNATTDVIGVGVNYQMRRWLIWNVGVTNKDRSSSDKSYELKRNVYGVGAQVSL